MIGKLLYEREQEMPFFLFRIDIIVSSLIGWVLGYLLCDVIPRFVVRSKRSHGVKCSPSKNETEENPNQRECSQERKIIR